MQTHGTGPIEGNRLGAYPTTQGFRMTLASMGHSGAVSSADKRLFKVKASPSRPVLMKVIGVSVTTFNATGTVNIGSTIGGAQFISAQTIGSAPGTVVTPVATAFVLQADTEIYVRLTVSVGTATVGQYDFGIELAELNTDTPSSIE